MFKNVKADAVLPMIDTGVVGRRIKDLPPHALDIYKTLQKTARDHSGRSQAKWNAITEARARHNDKLIEIAQFDRATESPGKVDKSTLARREKLEKEAAEIRAEIKEIDADEIPGTVSPERVTEFFQSQKAGVFWKPRHGRPPRKDQSIADALKICREGRADFLAELNTAQRTKLSLAEARERAIADIDELVEKGQPQVGGVFNIRVRDYVGNNPPPESQGHIHWPGISNENASAEDKIKSAVALAAWINRDALVAKVDAMLAEHESPDALTKLERLARIAECKVALLSLEYDEGALVLAARKGGNDSILWRPQMSIPAVLQIEIDTSARPVKVVEDMDFD